jgi:hypothetical protein
MRTPKPWRFLGAAIAAIALVTLGAGTPAGAAVVRIGKVVQEPTGSGDEARFPDVVKLDDGRLMVVWYRAAEHAGTIGTIKVSFGTSTNGTWTWTAEHNALANQGTVMAGKDTRDPKLGKMNDGSVLLSFFVPGGGVWYSVWKPGWTTFADPNKLVVPGFADNQAEHGGILAVAGTDQVLVPFYTGGGGAYFARATYTPATTFILDVHDYFAIQTNSATPAADGYDDMYQEPSFVQYGDTIVAVVRHEQWLHSNTATRRGAGALVVTWSLSASTPVFTKSYWDVQANSHHLLKTSDGRLLFTFGDKAVTYRPTEGSLIANPTQLPWKTRAAGQKVLPIYNSGFSDQANPSSVEVSPGTFFTFAYNAKKYASSEGNGTSPSAGTLWILQTKTADY